MIRRQQAFDFWIGEGLSIRAANCLAIMGINSIAELQEFTPSELLKEPMLGRKTLMRVVDLLQERGLSLKAEVLSREEQIARAADHVRVARGRYEKAQERLDELLTGPSQDDDSIIELWSRLPPREDR